MGYKLIDFSTGASQDTVTQKVVTNVTQKVVTFLYVERDFTGIFFGMTFAACE